MTQAQAFVPRPILRSAGSHTYRPGETPQSIAGLYGQPASSYRDLVAANHNKPLRLHGIPAGSSATFAGLAGGESLRLPWFWFAGKNAHNRRMLAGGGGGDVQQDAVAAAVAAMITPYLKTPEAKAMLPVMVNALSLWWRQDHPQGGVPTDAAEITAYAKASASWMDHVGKYMPVDVAAAIPWNEVPFRALAIFQAASGADINEMNWGVINDFLEKNVAPGDFPAKYTPLDFKEPIDFAGNVPGTSGAFEKLPWLAMGQVRWDLLPISYLDPSGVPSEGQTEWLIGKIKAALAKKNAQSGSYQDANPPSGKWPSATPPDCSVNGPTFYPEKNADGLYTGVCSGCGKNALVNPVDGMCDCKPGFELDVNSPGQHDCKPIGEGPFAGGNKPQLPAKEEESSATPIIIAGGILLGAVALYFANRKN